MTSIFEDNALDMKRNAPAPDAEAKTIAESGQPIKKKRGRQPGQKNAPKVNANNQPLTEGDFKSSASAANTIVFSMACVFTGTKEAWPSKEKEEVMDKALARYMALKDFAIPPELALIGAYAAYFQEIAVKPEVRENVAAKFSGKFAWLSKIKQSFKRKPQQ